MMISFAQAASTMGTRSGLEALASLANETSLRAGYIKQVVISKAELPLRSYKNRRQSQINFPAGLFSSFLDFCQR